MTNADFAQHDEEFCTGCFLAGVEPTKRQASKFRRSEGLAYKAIRFRKNNPPEAGEPTEEYTKRVRFYIGVKVA